MNLRLDELSDDSDIDLILPDIPNRNQDSLLSRICCAMMWNLTSIYWTFMSYQSAENNRMIFSTRFVSIRVSKY